VSDADVDHSKLQFSVEGKAFDVGKRLGVASECDDGIAERSSQILECSRLLVE
jgi:hypothetical protein